MQNYNEYQYVYVGDCAVNCSQPFDTTEDRADALATAKKFANNLENIDIIVLECDGDNRTYVGKVTSMKNDVKYNPVCGEAGCTACEDEFNFPVDEPGDPDTKNEIVVPIHLEIFVNGTPLEEVVSALNAVLP